MLLYNISMDQKKENLVFILDEEIKFDSAVWAPGNYPLHYHNHFEFELITAGKGSQIFNGEKFELAKNDIFLLRPTDYHQVTSEGITISHIKVKPSILPEWIIQKLHSFKNPIVFHLTDKQFEKFNFLFKMLKDETEENNNNNSLDIRFTLVETIVTMFIRLGMANTSLYDDSVPAKVIYFLEKNNKFTQKVSLDEISKYIGYSKFYTSSIFHKQCGITIQDFIINHRIEYAKKLIIETDLSITEIVIESGFASTSNFYSKFIKYVGCSPLKFRKDNK